MTDRVKGIFAVVVLLVFAVGYFVREQQHKQEYEWIWKNGLRAEATVTGVETRKVWRRRRSQTVKVTTVQVSLKNGETGEAILGGDEQLSEGQKTTILYAPGQFGSPPSATEYPKGSIQSEMLEGTVYTESFVRAQIGAADDQQK